MAPGVFDRATEQLAALTTGSGLSHGTLAFTLEPAQLLPVVRKLRNDLGFDLLLDVTAIDWLPQTPRFEVVWHFYSTSDHVRVRLKTRVAEADPTVDSLTALYGSAAFMERECHEMFGVAFRGNNDLRPVLLYEGFVGHPLRKDYPKDREQPLVPYRT
jgi:NADH-quinone oxidoreductase subunit C